MTALPDLGHDSGSSPAHHDHDHDDHDHGHDHEDEHAHDHDHDHPHEHDHDHGGDSWWARLFHLHGHEHGLEDDATLEGSERGIWALKISLLSLLVTALFQVIIVVASGSVALLADTIHNFADAGTAIPLWIAFALNRRQAPRGYTYRWGKAEDLAGVLVVVIIAISAGVVFYETWRKIVHPQPISNLPWVAAAAIIGFAGNEIAALVRIRTGRRIGSAALVADGMHARIDGLTSLAVLLGAIGVWLGFPLADPIIGGLIGVAILFIVRDAAVTMWRRLMDAVDPELLDRMEDVAGSVPGVRGVHDVRLRWIGHALWSELHIEVDGDVSTADSHHIAENVRHDLYHALPRLREITVHVDPCPCDTGNPIAYHELTAHHAVH
jgi:cation diffusion facilitator family transporter